MRPFCTGLVALVLLSLAACSQHEDWERVPPTAVWLDRAPLPEARTVRIAEGQQRAAMALLRSTRFVHVSQEQAEVFCSCKLESMAPLGWWLVRSVTYQTEGDGIETWDADGSILVRRTILGSGGPLLRDAVLVAPQHVPVEAYADCGAAR